MLNKWIGLALVAAAAQAAAACDSLLRFDEQVAHCSKALELLVASPRTLKEHDIAVRKLGDGVHRRVTIDYEVANAYGRVERDEIRCDYEKGAEPVMALAILLKGQNLPEQDLAKVNGQVTLAEY